jgi:DnaK suppressor protein
MRIMPTNVQPIRKSFSALEKQLATQRDELRARINQHSRDVVMDRELDDETAMAVEGLFREVQTATLERERRTLKEVESALARMKKGEYGTCDSCGVVIPRARLEALPWARRCIHCAETALNPGTLRMAM